MNCRRIFYSGLLDETRELSTHRKYEFNNHSELDIKAEEIYITYIYSILLRLHDRCMYKL